MPKKDFLKRMGQIYALGIQQGFTEEELIEYANSHFLFLYNEHRQKEIREHIAKANYTEHRYRKEVTA